MKIAVIGTGYVGLVTGTCFAERGNTVVCVDIDEAKVKKMQAGTVPIYEPGLEVLFEQNIKANRLSFTTDLRDGLNGAEVVFLALPTPPGEDGSADLSYILKASADIAPLLKEYVVIVDKSTVPVGTADKVHAVISQNTAVPFDVVSNPEFLKEGYAVDDFMNPDRVVIGAPSERAKKVMDTLYEPFITDDNAMIHMDVRSAEMTKYAANSFLATKISFMNEIANLCERVGADVDAVRHGIGSDSRIGHKFLYPGIGYGGSCFPKDVQALQKIANEQDYELEILRAVEIVNAKQKTVLVRKMMAHFADLRGKHIALWGLAFKANTDDIREAPALQMIDELLDKGATVSAYDPEATANVKRVMGKRDGLNFAQTKEEALKNADCLVVATEWNEFVDADMSDVLKELNQPVVFDGRNIYDQKTMKKRGATYISIGRS